MTTTQLEGFRLSPQQRRLWLLGRDAGVFRTVGAVALHGPLSAPALRGALHRLIARYGTLRTGFNRISGMELPVQTVEPDGSVDWHEEEANGGDPADALDRRIATELRSAGVGVADGARLRATLIRVEPEHHFLVLAVPSVLADGDSLRVLVGELTEVYERAVAGSLDGAGEEAVSYVQLAGFLEHQIESPDDDEGPRFWRRQPAVEADFRFPFEHPDPGAFRPAWVDGELTAETMRRLEGRTEAEGTCRDAALLACWAFVAARAADRDDGVVAEVVGGRDYEILQEAVGLFARAVPVHFRIAPDAPFEAFLSEVTESRGDSRRWAEHFLWGRGEDGDGESSPSVGFEVSEPIVPAPASNDSVRWSAGRRISWIDRFGILLSVTPTADGGAGFVVAYDAGRFPQAEAERLARRFERFVEKAAESPANPLGGLDLVPEAERRLVLDELQPEPRLGEPAGVLESFLDHVKQGPDRPAVTFAGETKTYRQLDVRARRLAALLKAADIGRGARVAILLDRSPQAVAALLAVLATGGAYAILDPSQARRRLALMLEEISPAAIVSETEVADRLELPELPTILVDRDRDAIAATEPLDPVAAPLPRDLAYVVFTSGSTGRPKGVAVEHGHLASYVDAATEFLGLPEHAGYAITSTFAADLGHTSLFPALTLGGCLHIVTERAATDPEEFGAAVGGAGVDCLKIVPSHLEALLTGSDPAAALPRELLVLGGEALRRPLLKKVRELVPECRIFNHYGPSETTVGVLAHPAEPDDLDPRAATVPLGRPLPGARVYLLDAALRPVPVWEPGEVFIGGDSVSRGYLGQPRQTAERFLPDPHTVEPGGRMYRSGDLARLLSAGVVEFLGRADDQIKFHGFRIELGEIQAALEAHEQIRDSVVQLARDEDGRDVLIAFYVARREQGPDELRWFVEKRLPEEILPNFFVHLRRLPLTLNGKVNYEALPPLDEVRRMQSREVEPVRTPTEEVLAGIWSELLRVDVVGRDSNFFVLGGHSLLATQLVSRIRRVFDVEVPLRYLFEDPVITGLAERIDRLARKEVGSPRPPLEPRDHGGKEVPSFAQERLWYMHRLDPESSAYNMPVALRLRGRLDRKALSRSLEELIRRHESLRTRLVEEDGQPMQVIDPPAPPDLRSVDLTTLPSAEREEALTRIAAVEGAEPFDLAKGPLLRTTLVELGEEDHAALFILHHVICDGWSLGVLVRDFVALYGGFSEGRRSPLPELSLQYADFARWQRAWLQGEVLEEELDHWRERLRGAPEEIDLPVDHPRREELRFEGSKERIELSSEVAERLRALSREENATLFMTLLAGYDLLLNRLTGQDDLVVGTDIANRNREELERLVGFFVNNLALRVDVSGAPTFRELVARVREVTLDAYNHQDLPFELLVQDLRPRRELARTPIFQTLFVLQNAPAEALRLSGLEVTSLDAGRSHSKFDLSLFMNEVDERLVGELTYKTNLFDASTVRGFARSFERLLHQAAEDPERPIGQLEMLTAEERRELEMERQQRRESKRSKLKTVRRRRVDPTAVSLVELETLLDDRSMPLVFRPRRADVEISEWAIQNRDLVEENLRRHGALLFRGFGLDTVPSFERFATAVGEELFGQYGDLPRESEGEKVYESTPYPPDKTILFHNESSHLHRWPLTQMFFCHTAARERGETPIVDCRQTYRELDPEIRDEMEAKGLLYVRNFVEELDVSWQKFFKTDDRSEVESFCHRAGIDFEWTEHGLRTLRLSPAVARHPKTGEKTFFNQIQLHHIACLDPEVRRSMLTMFSEEHLPRNVYYGDGTKIDDEVVDEILDLYWGLSVAFPWQAGDVLVVDNMLVAHARNPYVGPRKIVVAMAEMTEADEVVPA